MRDNKPEVMLGLPIALSTVSSVFSIFRTERVRASCFLVYRQDAAWRKAWDNTHLAERFPRFDSSKMHSWFPVAQRLHGFPSSAPTHFIFNRRHTVQALRSRRLSHASQSKSGSLTLNLESAWASRPCPQPGSEHRHLLRRGEPSCDLC